MENKTHRIRVAATFVWLGLALCCNARAVDPREWSRKDGKASERFLMLSSFHNELPLDKVTKLAW